MSLRTWNHMTLNLVLDGVTLTDFNGDVTMDMDNDFWDFVEGQNDSVERSYQASNMMTVTLPMQATSPQLDFIAGRHVADATTGAGPYLFVAIDTARNFKITGLATITKIGLPTRSKTAAARTVTLKVVPELSWLGA